MHDSPQPHDIPPTPNDTANHRSLSAESPTDHAPPLPWGFWATFGWIGAIVGVALLVQLVGGLIVGVAIGVALAIRGEDISHIEHVIENNYGLITSIVGTLGFAAAVAMLPLPIVLRGRSFAEYLALRGFSVLQLCFWTVGLLAVIASEVAVGMLLDRPIPGEMEELYTTAHFIPLLWLLIVVAAPIAEELVFRGFAHRGFTHCRLGVPGTIVLTSLLWTLLHVQYGAYDLLWVFALGLLFGAARHYSGSVTLCIVLHAITNAIALLLLGYALA
jgi:membrane protease YdiL (CAAX protease family)